MSRRTRDFVPLRGALSFPTGWLRFLQQRLLCSQLIDELEMFEDPRALNAFLFLLLQLQPQYLRKKFVIFAINSKLVSHSVKHLFDYIVF